MTPTDGPVAPGVPPFPEKGTPAARPVRKAKGSLADSPAAEDQDLFSHGFFPQFPFVELA